MWYLLAKALLSGAVVAAASEVARRWPGFGGLIVSLPLVSLMAMIWLWRDRPDPVGIAAFSTATFWYILPSLPMFLTIPVLLGRGWGFAAALVTSCLMTMALYVLLTWLGPKLGMGL
jgi:hypothetical protein